MYEMSVCGMGRDPFQRTFDVCTGSNGLGWIELQMDSCWALWVMSMVIFILLPAGLLISVNYFEEVYERHFKKSKYVYVTKQFTYTIFKAAQTHNWIFVGSVHLWKDGKTLPWLMFEIIFFTVYAPCVLGLVFLLLSNFHEWNKTYWPLDYS